jgi:hypothetical protein
LRSPDEDESVPKPVWRVKLVTELQAGEPTEVELAVFERHQEVAPVALAAPALAGMPAQTPSSASLGAAQARTRPGRHRTFPAARR